MGRYIAIGLTVKMKLSKSSIDKFNGREELIKKMENNGFDMSLYDMVEDVESLQFTIKEKYAHVNISKFIKEVYDYIYGNEYKYMQEETLKAIESCSGWGEVTAYAYIRRSYLFQSGENVTYLKYGPFSKDYAVVKVSTIDLALQGKILTETEGGVFDVLQKLLREKFQSSKLGNALVVYITL